MRFELANGDRVPIPCNRSSCPVCSRRQARISATMLGLDAKRELPRVCSTFTTRDRVQGAAELRDLTAQIVKLVRSEIPAARPCHILEFTTGQGTRSGGQRRPHLHSLWKGVDPGDGLFIRAAAENVLERRVGAYHHEAGEIRSPGGVVAYVANHHLKESQAPPKSWGSVRRIRPGRGYYSLPAPELRTLARRQVQEIGIWRRVEAGLADQVADQELPQEVADEYVSCLVDQALAAGPPRVVQVSKPWEDPLGA